MSVDIKNTSRLNMADLKVIDNIEFWDILDLPVYVPLSTDVRHVVSDGDRLDLIANLYYQNYALDWVIAWANDLELLPVDLIINTTLYIPSITFIKSNLLNGLVI